MRKILFLAIIVIFLAVLYCGTANLTLPPAAEKINSVDITGSNQDLTLSYSSSTKLNVVGSGNRIVLIADSNVVSIDVTGSNNQISVPSAEDISVTTSGSGNVVTRFN